MKQKNQNTVHDSRDVVQVARLHLIYVLAIVVQIIMYDVWKLLTPQSVMQRWLVAAALLIVTTIVWVIAKSKPRTLGTYQLLVSSLVVIDIFVASFAVYTQRGMASRAVFLYIAPIVVSAVLRSRSAILAATALCVAAYTSVAISYFVLNFNEGYKIELYGEVGFYTIMLLILGLLVWVIARPQNQA